MTRALALASVLAWPSVVSACPDCDASRAARSAFLNDPSFVAYAFSTALPIVLIVIVAALLYRIGAPSPVDAQGDQR